MITFRCVLAPYKLLFRTGHRSSTRRRGDSEGVPEPGQPRVLQHPGVGELVRCLQDAGPVQGDCAGRQRAPVQGDRDRVAHAPVCEQRQARADTGKASRLLACTLRVTAQDDQDLRALLHAAGLSQGQATQTPRPGLGGALRAHQALRHR